MEAVSKTAVAVARVTQARASFDLKGVTAPVTVLRLRSRDLNMVDRQLRAKVTKLPQFFQDAPVIVDLGELEGGVGDLSLPTVVHMLRACGVVPVGAINVADGDREAVRAAGLAMVQMGPARTKELPAEEPAEAPTPAAKPEPKMVAPDRKGEPAAQATPGPMVIRQAVRSGQVIYARNTDLIVLAPVSPGAQIFADGNVHVYSTLRGRAMAGAQGMVEARLFVQKLEAELVAIAGAYVMPDDVPESLRGKAVHAYLENGECRLTGL